ncbi:MAG: hypothetical protein NTU51_00810 [Bacteroidetes bacterium]|nr:hypothetical protein [Bacteroidota bacterium]
MITNFKKYENKLTDIQPDEMLNTSPLPDFMGFERLIVCLESYWSYNIFNNFSMKPYLENIGWMVKERIEIAHRFIDCELGLRYYINVLMQDQIFPPVIYISSHGNPLGNLEVSYEGEITPEELCEAFRGFGTYPVLVYFSSCDLFKGEKGKHFAQEFLKISGAAAVAGFSQKVNVIDSIIVDNMFLSRFFMVPDPFSSLSLIYESVIEDYRINTGFTIFVKGNDNSQYSALEKQSVIKTKI